MEGSSFLGAFFYFAMNSGMNVNCELEKNLTNPSSFYTVEEIETAGYFLSAKTGFDIRLVFQRNRPQEEKKDENNNAKKESSFI